MNNSKSSKSRFGRRLQSVIRETGSMLLLVLGLLAARSSLADHYYVPSGSMEPTLLPGDRVVVDKANYGLRLPFTSVEITAGDTVQRGEVVIFDSPRDGTRLIKRIVAVGGDEVSVRNGRLSINGQALEHATLPDAEIFGSRTIRLNLQHGGGPDFAASVPDGMLLAMGDHRGNSLDGRMFGLVSEATVYGRAIAVYHRSGSGFVWHKL